MEASLFLARFWGWYLIIFFVILSLNPRRIKQIFEDLEDHKFLILAASAAIVLGLVSLLFHNIWEPGWPIIITGLGWISLFIGLGLFIFPDSTTRQLTSLNVRLVQVIYIILFLTGLFLLNMGYALVMY